jgi:hypothetical protein
MRFDTIHAGRAVTVMLLLALGTAPLASCAEKHEEHSAAERPAENMTLDEDLYGFRLGEWKDDLYERSRYRLQWEELPDPRLGYRGELYRLSGTLDGSRDIDHVRVAFLDGHLWELVVYFRDTGFSTLRNTRRRLEREYGVRATSPDGAVEKTYKTYHFDLPEMSVTLCRFTKKPKDELYLQYMHKELHRRLLERRQNE